MWRELLQYLLFNKNWWLIPVAIVFTLLGILIVFSFTSPVGPFVYMLF